MLALQLATQMPENPEDAAAVLQHLTWLVEDYMTPPAKRGGDTPRLALVE